MATTVTFDGVDATDVTVASATELTATVPAGAAGAVDVVVATSGGSVTVTDGYTYAAASPTLTSVTPETADTFAGLYTITGTGLDLVASADADYVLAYDFDGSTGGPERRSLFTTVVSPTELTYEGAFTQTPEVGEFITLSIYQKSDWTLVNQLTGAIEVVATPTLTTVTPTPVLAADMPAAITLTGTGLTVVKNVDDPDDPMYTLTRSSTTGADPDPIDVDDITVVSDTEVTLAAYDYGDAGTIVPFALVKFDLDPTNEMVTSTGAVVVQ